MFDASYLHGVIPGRGLNPRPHSNARRLTFMVGFWKEIAAKNRGLDCPGPAQPFPAADSGTTFSWPAEMKCRSEFNKDSDKYDNNRSCDADSSSGSSNMIQQQSVHHLTRIWEPVEAMTEVRDATSTVVQLVETPHYSTCFQGF